MENSQLIFCNKKDYFYLSEIKLNIAGSIDFDFKAFIEFIYYVREMTWRRWA